MKGMATVLNAAPNPTVWTEIKQKTIEGSVPQDCECNEEAVQYNGSIASLNSRSLGPWDQKLHAGTTPAELNRCKRSRGRPIFSVGQRRIYGPKSSSACILHMRWNARHSCG